MPPVPISPEPLAALQARYQRALEYVYEQEQIAAKGGIRPGEVAANVFDFDDGLRLIVGRERDPEGEVMLHFSASFTDHGAIADRVRERRRQGASARKLLREVLAHMLARFGELSGDVREPEYWGMTDGRIPHWVIMEVKDET